MYIVILSYLTRAIVAAYGQSRDDYTLLRRRLKSPKSERINGKDGNGYISVRL